MPKNKTPKYYAMVTGSADRIGKAIALELAEKGHHILLHYNTSERKVDKVKSEIQEKFSKIKVETVQINFSEPQDFNKLFSKLRKRNINIDILINCASDFRPSGFQNIGSEMLRKELTINFEGAYLLTKSFAKVFGEGVIINFLDTKITKNTTKHLDYLLSKKLLADFTQLAAVELAPKIRVNGIGPGLILPPPGENEEYLRKLSQKIPLQTIGNLEEILKALRFLLESRFVTGQIIFVDGGDHLI